MVRSMAFSKRIVAFILAIFTLFSLTFFSVSSEDVDEWSYYYTVEHVLIEREGFTEEELKYESIDNVDYIYIVEDGAASILNMQVQYKGPEKKSLTLPETLGGFPVTAFGYVGKKIEVFAYIWYGEELETDEYGYTIYPEYTPGLDYVSKFIIPEGYEYIGDLSLHSWSVPEFQFPKSLKVFCGMPLDLNCFPTTIDPITQRELAIFPECEYEYKFIYQIYYMIESDDIIVLPSRNISFTKYMLSVDDAIGHHFYVPSNLSFESIRDALFYYDDFYHEDEWKASQGYEIDGGVNYSTLYFAADSDIPEQIEALKGDNPYPIIADLPVPTHIAFDSDAVSVSVGEVVDLEAKTYPSEAVWTACDYVSSNPEVVKVDPYSGRITALAEGEATITATHVERGFVDTCTVKVENKPEHICTPAEKWSADETAHWLECSDPECGEIVNYAEHSGGNATVNAKAVCEYCGTAYGEYVAASFSVEPVSDIAYCAREKREYKITVAENADKVQFIRDSGSTTTFVRSQAAEIINNGDGTETWILAVSLNKGKYTLATKYDKVWNKNGIEFEIVFDTPKCRSFTSEKVGNLTTFTVVTDPQVAKVQLITQSGNTLTYTQSNSYIGEDGLRYWTVVRKITKPGTIGLRTKYGYTWTTTDFTIEV